jgi:hypothetical protein
MVRCLRLTPAGSDKEAHGSNIKLSIPSELENASPLRIDTTPGSPPVCGPAEWTEETDEHPIPPFGLDSPVVEHLLRAW